MTLEFIFEDTLYKYEDGKIYYKDSWNCFGYFCPVLNELNEILDTCTTNQCIAIFEAIVHSYLYGHSEGKKAKIREFKRVFNLD